MNAKKLKEVNQRTAYVILEKLYEQHLWDPVVTNRMSNIQCENRFNKALNEYFKTEQTLCYWNKNTAHNILLENTELIPMMQAYNYNTYKEENEL